MRTTLAVMSIVCATTAALLVDGAGTAHASSASVSKNLIQNAGADIGTGSDDGSSVPVADWSTPSDASPITEVQYGASGGFPQVGDPGSKHNGKNFFAGGQDTAVAVGVQSLALKKYASAIKAGTATYALAGYLGGYSDQEDHTVLSVDWLDRKGATVGTTAIGPVTAEDRSDDTGLLVRKTTGTVPVRAVAATITLTLTRDSGTYDDGYADGLTLTIATS